MLGMCLTRAGTEKGEVVSSAAVRSAGKKKQTSRGATKNKKRSKNTRFYIYTHIYKRPAAEIWEKG